VSTSPYGAVTTNGTSQYGTVTHNAAYNLTTATSWTIDISFKTAAAGMLLHKFSSSTGWKIEVLAGGDMQITLNTTTLTGGSSLLNSAWHQIRLAVDRLNHVAYLFVDGTLADQEDISAVASTDTSANLLIGYDGASNYFTGTLAEVRLSDVCRSHETYSVDSVQYFDDVNTLLLLHFNEGQGATTYDMASGVRNNCALTGSPTYAFGNLESNPPSVWREQVWYCIDNYTNLTTWMTARNGQKFRLRMGDPRPTYDAQIISPGLLIVPAAIAETRAETRAFHRRQVPMIVRGYVQGEDNMSEMTGLANLVDKAVWSRYQGTTGGRFEHIMIQNMKETGPRYEVFRGERQPSSPLFASFTSIFTAEYRTDLIGA